MMIHVHAGLATQEKYDAAIARMKAEKQGA